MADQDARNRLAGILRSIARDKSVAAYVRVQACELIMDLKDWKRKKSVDTTPTKSQQDDSNAVLMDLIKNSKA